MEIYHVVDRSIDKKIIFPDPRDYERFVFNLYELNNQNRSANSLYRFNNLNRPPVSQNDKEADPLVDLYAFCAMPTHHHTALSPLVDNALPAYMHKINMSFSKYFNTKYERKGPLFAGPYKSILIEREGHFAHIIVYIHLNPLDLKFPEWRKRPLNNKEIKEALKYLETYRWSSHLDYLNMSNFPSVTSRKFFLDYFDGTKGYEKALINWLKSPKFSLIGLK